MNCKTHPDAPHSFMRDASHSAGRYVCECESWEPPKNKPMTKTEWKEWLEESWAEAQKLAASRGEELRPIPVQEFARAFGAKEWIGLTDEEMDELVNRFARYGLAREIESKLKEKNT